MRIAARLETETTIRQVSAPTTRMALRSHPLLSRTVWLWICHRCGSRMAEEETFHGQRPAHLPILSLGMGRHADHGAGAVLPAGRMTGWKPVATNDTATADGGRQDACPTDG